MQCVWQVPADVQVHRVQVGRRNGTYFVLKPIGKRSVFSPTASQTLAYLADMQEAGISVTYGYISDLHDKKSGAVGCTSPGNGARPR